MNVAMAIRICDYLGKMEEMLETGTYRRGGLNSNPRRMALLPTGHLLSLPPLFPTTHPSFPFFLSPSTLSPGSCPTKLLLTPGRQRAEARTKAQLAGYWCSTSLTWPHPIPQGTGCGHARLVQYLENVVCSRCWMCVCVLPCLSSRIRKTLEKMQVIN